MILIKLKHPLHDLWKWLSWIGFYLLVFFSSWQQLIPPFHSTLYCLPAEMSSNNKNNFFNVILSMAPSCSPFVLQVEAFGSSPALIPLPLCPPTANCSTGAGKWLTSLFVLHAFLSCRCYTKKTWGQELRSPSLPRCRGSNTIKRTLARYFEKKQAKDAA